MAKFLAVDLGPGEEAEIWNLEEDHDSFYGIPFSVVAVTVCHSEEQAQQVRKAFNDKNAILLKQRILSEKVKKFQAIQAELAQINKEIDDLERYLDS